MRYFTPSCLTSAVPISAKDVGDFCDFYHVDSSVVVRELAEFRAIYKQLQAHVTMDDLTKLACSTSRSQRHRDASAGDAAVSADVDVAGNSESSDSERDVSDDDNDIIAGCRKTTVTSWTDYGFIKPLRLLQQLSGFTTLHYVYKILVTLPVTSCSAERAMSRVRIVKNRLRSTMLDDWFSSLLCLASEKEILATLELANIVDRFADCSDVLRRHLIYS
jgi:hypothetical protein